MIHHQPVSRELQFNNNQLTTMERSIYLACIYFVLLIAAVATFSVNTTNVMKIKPSKFKSSDVDTSTSPGVPSTSNRNTSNEDESFIKSTLFPPDLHKVLLAFDALPNSLCKNDSKMVMEAVVSRQKWALKMFDSSPKFPVGMLYGSYYQLGNFDECISIKESFSHPDRLIKGQYCLTDIALDTNNGQDERVARSNGHFYNHGHAPLSRIAYNNTLRWAICVPSSCSPKEVEQFLSELFLIAISYRAITIQVPEHRCHYEMDIPFTTAEIIYGSLIGIFLAFVLLATIYHLICMYRKSNNLDYNVNIQSATKPKLYQKIIMSFSLVQSTSKLLHVGKSELNLECISGIKFLSMLLIVGSHTLLFLVGGPVANEEFYAKAVTKPQNAILLNNPLLVDTFLLVGGFLMCRLLLIQLEKTNGKINILLLYVARYIRLTPSYIIIIGLYCTFLIRLDSGPLWDERITLEKDRCIKSWWANILYINNYVSTDHICMFQSWYLSVDTHLFVVAPFVIYPLWKWPRIGELLLGLLTFLAAFVPFIITYFYELDPTQMTFPSEISDIALNSYFVFAYMKTHMRATSYCIGLVAGYIVHRLQSSNTKISRSILWMNWSLAIVFGLSSVFSVTVFYLPDHAYDAFEAAAYSSLHKIAWSLCIGWIIIACVTDNAGPVQKFLSWAPFAPLSRLTYTAYLVNGLIGLHSYGTLRAPTYMSVNGLTSTALAHFLLTFAAGFVLCILFESPIHSLEKCFLRKDPKPKPDCQQVAMVNPKL